MPIAKMSPACVSLMSAIRPLMMCYCVAAFVSSVKYNLVAFSLQKQFTLACEKDLISVCKGDGDPSTNFVYISICVTSH